MLLCVEHEVPHSHLTFDTSAGCEGSIGNTKKYDENVIHHTSSYTVRMYFRMRGSSTMTARGMTSGWWMLALVLLAAPAIAHDLWVERQGRSHTLYYGHERSGHGGERKLDYRPESVKRLACFNVAGREMAAEVSQTYPVSLRGDCAASWFFTSSGYWSKTPYGTKNIPKTEAGPVLTSWLSVETVKRLDAWGDALTRPLTRELEIVPLNNPLGLKPGDKLKVGVYRDGRPAAGITVAYFGHPRGVTGDDGTVNVRLKEGGYQLIQASIELPLDDGKADKAIHATALVFELRP